MMQKESPSAVKKTYLNPYHNLLMQIPVAILVLRGNNYSIELANNRALELIVRDKSFIGKPIFELIPEIKEFIKPIFDSVMQSGIGYNSTEVELPLSLNGKIEKASFNIVYEPINEEDNTISGLIVSFTEVTQQIKAQQLINEQVRERTLELQQANEELQKKNQEIALSKYNKRFLTEFSQHFSSYKSHNEFFNSLTLYLADITKIDYVFIGKLTQTDDDNFAIQTIALTSFGNLVDNITYPLPDGPCEQVIRGTLYSYPEQCRIIFPKNQTLVQFSVEGYIGYPLFDGQGNAIGLIAVMHQKGIEDPETVSSILKITSKRAEMEFEQMKYEAELEQKNKILEEKNTALEKMNKELESFTFISSHDLQEPLRQIQNFASRIISEEHQTLTEKGKNYFERMNSAANRMQTLIRDLLAYSRTTDVEGNFFKTPLNPLVEEVKAELKEIIDQKHAIIETGEMGDAKIIPFQFRQLLYNLIGNALKFSNPNTPPRIKINNKTIVYNHVNEANLTPGTEYSHITISDNGIGFDPQYKDRIFKVFQRLDHDKRIQGTGIGLAIVKKIVENHNGIITATSQLNKGATFDIYIPIN